MSRAGTPRPVRARLPAGLLLGPLVALVLAACGASRPELDPAAVDRLRRGVHTEAQAIELLGSSPDARAENADGTVVLRWSRGLRDPRSHRNASLVLHFDARGKLERIDRGGDVRGYEPGRR